MVLTVAGSIGTAASSARRTQPRCMLRAKVTFFPDSSKGMWGFRPLIIISLPIPISRLPTPFLEGFVVEATSWRTSSTTSSGGVAGRPTPRLCCKRRARMRKGLHARTSSVSESVALRDFVPSPVLSILWDCGAIIVTLQGLVHLLRNLRTYRRLRSAPARSSRPLRTRWRPWPRQ